MSQRWGRAGVEVACSLWVGKADSLSLQRGFEWEGDGEKFII